MSGLPDMFQGQEALTSYACRREYVTGARAQPRGSDASACALPRPARCGHLAPLASSRAPFSGVRIKVILGTSPKRHSRKFGGLEVLGRGQPARRARFFLESLPPERYPRLVEAAAPFSEGVHPDAYFAFGLYLLLAGIEAMAARKRRGPDPLPGE
jgi:hypothetical protein